MHNKVITLFFVTTVLIGIGWAAEGIVAGKLQGIRLRPEDVPIEITPMPFLSGDTLLYENFDEDWGPYGDNPPPGWTIIANGGDNTWNENDWNRYYWSSSQYYVARLYWYPYDTGEDILMSPVINCSNYCNVKLNCWTYASFSTGKYDWKICGSTDGGSTWPYMIRDYGLSSFGPGYETFNLDWADGQPNVRIRWRGDGDIHNINYWMVDNIQVSGDLRVANDVAVTKIISPSVKPFWPWGDTLYPVCEVTNYGTNPQSNIPVRCRMWDTLTHSIAYNEVQTVGPLEPMQKCTVYFTPFLPPPFEEHFFVDTMRTELSGDEKPENDARIITHKVTVWYKAWMKNHDGSFESGIQWTSPNGEWASRFAQTPSSNLTLSKVGLWVWVSGNNACPAQIIIYGWTGSAPKSDPIAVKDVNLQSEHNVFDFNVTVPDSPFVVSVKQLSVSPIFAVGMDYNEPIDDNDAWCRHPTYTGNTWRRMRDYSGYHCNLSLEAGYEGWLIDAALKGFPFPDTLNSDTVINFAVEVKNAGLVARNNIKVNMFFIHDPDGETLFALEGNTGPINAGQTKTVTFPDTWRTQPGKYIFAGYTQLLYDKNYENDSCQQAIFIRRAPGVMEEKVETDRYWFTLLPNPLTKGYGLLSYSVPQAGNARLKVFDVSGRTVMSLSFVASHSGEKRLDLRRLSAGVYWVKFETPSEEAIQKLIIR